MKFITPSGNHACPVASLSIKVVADTPETLYRLFVLGEVGLGCMICILSCYVLARNKWQFSFWCCSYYRIVCSKHIFICKTTAPPVGSNFRPTFLSQQKWNTTCPKGDTKHKECPLLVWYLTNSLHHNSLRGGQILLIFTWAYFPGDTKHFPTMLLCFPPIHG